MTEQELITYFEENYPKRKRTLNEETIIDIEKIEDQEIKGLIERSFKILAKTLYLYQYTVNVPYIKVVDTSDFRDIDLEKGIEVIIGHKTGKSLIVAKDTRNEERRFKIEHILNPMKAITEELPRIRERMSLSIDMAMEDLGKLLTNQESLEKQIKEWELE